MSKYVVVAGSSRNNSQSAKIAHFLAQRLVELDLASPGDTSVIDLGTGPLPLWPAEDTGPWTQYAAQLQAADAVIVVVPEWNGMACPAIKNFFIYTSKTELAHKPGLLVGVSAAVGGPYVVSEMRASSYKNCRLAYLPEHILVRHCSGVLNGPQAASEDDQRLRARIDYTLDILGKYTEALKPVRAAIDMSNPGFANGM